MKLEFDQKKSDDNTLKRGLPFDAVLDLDWATALIEPDTRKDYGENRFVGYVPDAINRLHIVCFTMRDDVMRVISLRKANNKEIATWQKFQKLRSV